MLTAMSTKLRKVSSPTLPYFDRTFRKWENSKMTFQVHA